MGSKKWTTDIATEIEQYGYYIDLFATLKVIVNSLVY